MPNYQRNTAIKVLPKLGDKLMCPIPFQANTWRVGTCIYVNILHRWYLMQFPKGYTIGYKLQKGEGMPLIYGGREKTDPAWSTYKKKKRYVNVKLK